MNLFGSGERRGDGLVVLSLRTTFVLILLIANIEFNVVFKHPVAIICHSFHAIYFRPQCNL
jgi:hypothetical protein